MAHQLFTGRVANRNQRPRLSQGPQGPRRQLGVVPAGTRQYARAREMGLREIREVTEKQRGGPVGPVGPMGPVGPDKVWTAALTSWRRTVGRRARRPRSVDSS